MQQHEQTEKLAQLDHAFAEQRTPLVVQLETLQQQLQELQDSQQTQRQQLIDGLEQKYQTAQQSAVGRRALEAGLISTIPELEALLQKGLQRADAKLKTSRL